jgi:hypothetical protein
MPIDARIEARMAPAQARHCMAMPRMGLSD